jgi:GT2 family glycosyltransferase
MGRWQRDSEREVGMVTGCLLMIRRDLWDRLGGFDERYIPAWFEDVDLCRRIQAGGGRIFFEPDARFIHHGGSSLSRLEPGQFQEFYLRNELRYFEKHFGAAPAGKVRRMLVAGLRLRALLSFVSPVIDRTTRSQSARICWRTARILRNGGTL